ncbi:hypothetical protein F1559_000419 [Cyanidiococcus yangmingshanensis]|uniref:Helicase C-terminal domain-containing protein n=1 Tax=Cyanidiococcus yangmingshanensis TaxID=2690220 RepID=A0A7J7IFH4_9RHOD|nr:hypothetical protein F1559_000419 [Cyanidiococcus yangmingshanensis]
MQDAKEDTTSFWALALHANQSPAEQERIFAPLSGSSTKRRKVICATNIAESSITVPDVVAVVDTCRVRSPHVQQAELSALQLRETWCSKASAAQRAGRAGRVCSGICWRLVPREPVWNQDLPETMQPELIRTPLERWLLWLLSWPQPQNGRHPRTLAQVEHLLTTETLTPVPEANVQAAIRRLRRMGALTSPFTDIAQCRGDGDRDDCDKKVELGETDRRSPRRQLREAINDSSLRLTPAPVVAATWTPLGRILAALPMDPAIGKLVVYGAVFGCLAWSLTAAAVLVEGSPFQRVLVDRDAVHRTREQAYGPLYSDISSAVYAWQQWAALLDIPAVDRDDPLQELLQRYGLSERTLESIRQTRASFERLILDMGFGLPNELVDWHEHETHARLHRAVLFAALFPHLIRVEPPRVTKYVSVHGGHMEPDESSPQALRLYDENGQRVWLHPSSLAWGDPSQNIRPVRWLTYAQRLETTRPYVLQVTCVPIFAVLLFAGREIVIRHEQRQVIIDGWIRFHCAARTASLLSAFRQQTDAVLSAYFAHMAGHEGAYH